ncbi:NADH dehydrogenase I subunit F [Desulfuromonas sp. DDH964]|uniref:NADH-quinone oxidoreductase subunit NuoF n=1 Tax=Desulfuromonas sp. DDH964 TaxID=1823759 RepID=UPI00078DC1C1|nr:NADH-quinone oxidoreductase subunit NuoF [Desulfuromonas sp. DDH964]AMV71090.1 NADH dehydrogenase I subunit F [Desulfuromonas sp. DDH964]
MSEQVLFKNRRPGGTAFLDDYRRSGGYEGLGKALKAMTPAEVRELVKSSGLRGRGGAGFATGLKWSFFPADTPGEKYLVCNADEMEPGTYKDRVLLEADPHQLVEGMIVSAYALQAPVGYIFIRYAYAAAHRSLERAIAEAKAAGFLGENILGSGFSFALHLHGSAGRYICGEETALLNSLEGKRANPRSKPPFPAVRGLFDLPTTVNNVETLANVPHIVMNGADWFKELAATDRGAGTKLYGLSGHLERTPCLELPLGTTLREIVEEHGGGVWQGKKFKACLPGGASTPYLTAAHLDTPLDFEGPEAFGSRLGTAGVTVFDESTCMVRATLNLNRFFARESCGWCTPCRDGLPYVNWLLEKIETGAGALDDIENLRGQIRNINGRSFCALAMGAMGPVESLLRLFGEEVEDHIKRGKCPLKS